MPMEGWVKCLTPQNTFGVSGVNSVAAKSNTIEVTGGPILPTDILLWSHVHVRKHTLHTSSLLQVADMKSKSTV